MSTTAVDPREQAKADIASLVRQAKRCQHITARITSEDPPTEWDRRHADINELLDELVGR